MINKKKISVIVFLSLIVLASLVFAGASWYNNVATGNTVMTGNTVAFTRGPSFSTSDDFCIGKAEGAVCNGKNRFNETGTATIPILFTTYPNKCFLSNDRNAGVCKGGICLNDFEGFWGNKYGSEDIKNLATGPIAICKNYDSEGMTYPIKAWTVSGSYRDSALCTTKGYYVRSNCEFHVGRIPIANCEDLQKVSQGNNIHLNYYLKNDVECSGLELLPIVGYTGKFEWNGKTIYNTGFTSQSDLFLALSPAASIVGTASFASREVPGFVDRKICGDYVCNPAIGENKKTCPNDCGVYHECGDGVCDAPTEAMASCPNDCNIVANSVTLSLKENPVAVVFMNYKLYLFAAKSKRYPTPDAAYLKIDRGNNQFNDFLINVGEYKTIGNLCVNLVSSTYVNLSNDIRNEVQVRLSALEQNLQCGPQAFPETGAKGKAQVIKDLKANIIAGVATTTENIELTNYFDPYKATIPAGVAIHGDANWDGKLIAPIVMRGSDFKALFTKDREINMVIEIGSDTSSLQFNQPIKVVFGGMSGKQIGWIDSATGKIKEIGLKCDSVTSSANINFNYPQECYFDDGKDIIVWTYHLTEFVVMSPPPAPAPLVTPIVAPTPAAQPAPTPVPEASKSVCGDGTCQSDETKESCAADCGPVCGDLKCDSNMGETCTNCAGDCGVCENPVITFVKDNLTYVILGVVLAVLLFIMLIILLSGGRRKHVVQVPSASFREAKPAALGSVGGKAPLKKKKR